VLSYYRKFVSYFYVRFAVKNKTRNVLSVLRNIIVIFLHVLYKKRYRVMAIAEIYENGNEPSGAMKDVNLFLEYLLK
jgi:hypothetical protein